MQELGCDCEAAEEAWTEFERTGELSLDGVCYYEEVTDLTEEQVEVYN